MCLDISTVKSHLVAVGLYDGSVAVFNLLKKEEIYRCKTAERHVDPVWAIKWQNDQFCSVSSDGMVKCWNPKTGETKDVITLYDDELAQGAKVGRQSFLNRKITKSCTIGMRSLHRISFG